MAIPSSAPTAAQANAQPEAQQLQFYVMGLFFIFGGITSLNDVIIPKLKELFTLNYTQAMLVVSHNIEEAVMMADRVLIFASDPDWKNRRGQLWRIETDGSSSLVEKDMGTTNGVEISPDQTRLYVNESAQRKVWVYDLDKKLQASNKRLLIQFPDFGLDGMRTDAKGHLYIARYGKGVVAKVSPDGKLLKEYKLKGEFPTNVTFSQKDPTLLYVTMQKRGAVELLKL
mgnify:CR=1 FL=1